MSTHAQAAPAQTSTVDNPMGTDGFEFVEYTAPDPTLLRTLFERLGFPVVARHRSKNVTLHRQGDINFIINAEPGSFGQRFAQQHGPSACVFAMPHSLTSAVSSSVRNLSNHLSGQWSCTFPRSKGLAAV